MDESKTNGYIALREIVIEKREIRLGIVWEDYSAVGKKFQNHFIARKNQKQLFHVKNTERMYYFCNKFFNSINAMIVLKWGVRDIDRVRTKKGSVCIKLHLRIL